MSATDERDERAAFETWWREQTKRGDPERRPHLTRDAFLAGMAAARASAPRTTDEALRAVQCLVAYGAAVLESGKSRRETIDLFNDYGHAAIDAVLAAPRTMATQEAWISVEDRLPAQYASVLIASHEGVEFARYADDADGRWLFFVDAIHDMTEERSGVTHWMPLPAAPVADEQTRDAAPEGEP